MSKMKKKDFKKIVGLIITIIVVIGGIYNYFTEPTQETPTEAKTQITTETQNTTGLSKATTETNATDEFTLSDIPAYSGDAYVVVNGNIPYFTQDDYTTQSYEFYSELDDLGRCGVCTACIGTDIMPTEKRGSISSVHPTGWIQKQYDCIASKDLYNRCHLIAFSLAGENANKQNLITGTRYMNEAMIEFEELVHDYVVETQEHVLYRVTPMFQDDNLVASGVLMEALSMEDEGDSVCYCVYIYNVQPGVVIDYATGESKAE